jgi:Asp-tRNA(Asn)/Glu-tRNA(Gln) amidotransferase B subunit
MLTKTSVNKYLIPVASIITPWDNFWATNKAPKVITKLNKPKVTILSGKVTIRKIGTIIQLIKDNITKNIVKLIIFPIFRSGKTVLSKKSSPKFIMI